MIVTARKLLLRAIKDVQESREPPHVIRESKLNRFPNMLIWYGVVPSSLDWKEHCRQLEAELKV